MTKWFTGEMNVDYYDDEHRYIKRIDLRLPAFWVTVFWLLVLACVVSVVAAHG